MSRDNEIPFEQFKEEVLRKVDECTSLAIYKGFLFDNHLFSMSLEAQINWSNIPMIPQTNFPLKLSCKDNSVYMLEFANKHAFYKAALDHKQNTLMNGTRIKELISVTETVEAINELFLNEMNSYE